MRKLFKKLTKQKETEPKKVVNERYRRGRPVLHTITYNGETKNLQEWAETKLARENGLTANTLRSRLTYGWPVEDILETPIGVKRQARKYKTYSSPVGADRRFDAHATPGAAKIHSKHKVRGQNRTKHVTRSDRNKYHFEQSLKPKEPSSEAKKYLEERREQADNTMHVPKADFYGKPVLGRQIKGWCALLIVDRTIGEEQLVGKTVCVKTKKNGHIMCRIDWLESTKYHSKKKQIVIVKTSLLEDIYEEDESEKVKQGV